MNTVETQKAKEAERHRKLRLKKKNELTRLKCLEKFLCDKYKLILDEFESGYDEGKNEYVAPQTRTSSSSQTDPNNSLYLSFQYVLLSSITLCAQTHSSKQEKKLFSYN